VLENHRRIAGLAEAVQNGEIAGLARLARAVNAKPAQAWTGRGRWRLSVRGRSRAGSGDAVFRRKARLIGDARGRGHKSTPYSRMGSWPPVGKVRRRNRKRRTGGTDSSPSTAATPSQPTCQALVFVRREGAGSPSLSACVGTDNSFREFR